MDFLFNCNCSGHLLSRRRPQGSSPTEQLPCITLFL